VGLFLCAEKPKLFQENGKIGVDFVWQVKYYAQMSKKSKRMTKWTTK